MSECIDLTDLENSNLENVNFGAVNSKKVKAENISFQKKDKKPLQPSNTNEIANDEVVLSKSGPAKLNKDASGTVDDDIEVLGTTGESVADWPHAREHCIKNPFGTTDHAATCKNCMCFVCEVSSSECSNWAQHCHAQSSSQSWLKARENHRNGIPTEPPVPPKPKAVPPKEKEEPKETVRFTPVFIVNDYRSSKTFEATVGHGVASFRSWLSKTFGYKYGSLLRFADSYEKYLRAVIAKNKQEETHRLCAFQIVENYLCYKDFYKAMSTHLRKSDTLEFLVSVDRVYKLIIKVQNHKQRLQLLYVWLYQGTLAASDVPVKPLKPVKDTVIGACTKLSEFSWTCTFKPLLATNLSEFESEMKDTFQMNKVARYISKYGLYLKSKDFYTCVIGKKPDLHIFRALRNDANNLGVFSDHKPSNVFKDLDKITHNFQDYAPALRLRCKYVNTTTLKFTVTAYLTRTLPRRCPVFYERFVLKERPDGEDTFLALDLSKDEASDVDPTYSPLEEDEVEAESSSDEEVDEEDEKPVYPVVQMFGDEKEVDRKPLSDALIFEESPADCPRHSLCTNAFEFPLAKTAEEEGYEAEGRYIHLECSLRMTKLLSYVKKNIFGEPDYSEDSLDVVLKQQYHRGGRTVAEQPSGLTMTLRNYQLQDLQWMLDQETGEGGISRYFWSKVGNVYYCPHLGLWSESMPAPTKGGVLADEMGLGKTIVTLSLVLANPAQEEALGKLIPPELVDVKREVNSRRYYWFRKRKKISAANAEAHRLALAECRKTFLRQVHTYGFDLRTRARMEVIFSIMLATVPVTEANMLDTMLLAEPINIKLPKNASQQTKADARMKAQRAQEVLIKGMLNILVATRKFDPKVDENYLSVKDALQRVNALRTKTTIKGTLVICHVSLVSQWVAEARKASASTLRICCYYGSNRPQSVEELQEFDVVVTTYAVLNSDSRRGLSHQKKISEEEYQPPLMQVKWHRLVLDESHALRNAGGSNVKLCSKLSAETKWCMTGTPMAKDVREMYGQLKFVLGNNPILGSLENYKTEVSSRDYRYRLFKAMMIIHGKKQMFCGKKVLADLPPIEKFHVRVDFTPGERLEYFKLKSSTYNTFVQEKNVASVTYLLSLMNPIRRACAFGVANSRIVEDGSAKAKQIKLTNSKANTSMYTKNLPLSVATSKISFIMKHIRTQLSEAPDSKVLIFTSFAPGVEVVAKALRLENISFVTLLGGSAESARRKALEKFNHDETTKVFLMSIRSGGVGINITRANLVYILEPNLNSALEKQAIGRVHRMGQTRKVKIFHMIMKNSIEERVLRYRDMVVKAKQTTHNPLTKKRKERDDEETIKINVSSYSQRQRLVEYLELFLQ